ncbi:MAG: Crp/Fnr family transcriptional regulator [Microgenomates group bacterium]
MEPAIQKKLDAFFSQHKQQKFKKGEILIRADSQPSGILYLTKGTVKQYAISMQGVEQLLTIYKPFSFFPMIWAINDTPNTHYFEALSEVTVWNAPKNSVVAFIKKEPEILYDLLSRLYRGMGTLLSRIEYFMTGSAYQKVVFTILNTAARFGEKQTQTSGVILHTTHKEIAAFSGLTKETISRESRKLQERGLIENTNHIIIIKNMRKLEAELLNHSLQ